MRVPSFKESFGVNFDSSFFGKQHLQTSLFTTVNYELWSEIVQGLQGYYVRAKRLCKPFESCVCLHFCHFLFCMPSFSFCVGLVSDVLCQTIALFAIANQRLSFMHRYIDTILYAECWYCLVSNVVPIYFSSVFSKSTNLRGSPSCL